MKPDNQGELGSRSAPASGKPIKVDEWSEEAPSNAYNNARKGQPFGNEKACGYGMSKKDKDEDND